MQKESLATQLFYQTKKKDIYTQHIGTSLYDVVMTSTQIKSPLDKSSDIYIPNSSLNVCAIRLSYESVKEVILTLDTLGDRITSIADQYHSVYLSSVCSS